MSANAREALRQLVASLEAHFLAVEGRRGPEDAAVDDAYENVAETFERYEELLDVDFAESLPMVLDFGDDDDVDDIDDDDSDDDGQRAPDALRMEDLDPHAEENEDEFDDDLDDFDLR
jgi:hypothetical protein